MTYNVFSGTLNPTQSTIGSVLLGIFLFSPLCEAFRTSNNSLVYSTGMHQLAKCPWKDFTASSVKTLFESIDSSIVSEFIKETHFYNQL